MLTCDKAYQMLEELGVDIVQAPFTSRVAAIAPQGLLAINYSAIETQQQELAVLLEEIGHFETYAFYPKNASYDVWQKQENRAFRHVFERYYPPDIIVKGMRAGNTQLWELAEWLSLPERFVSEMLRYYTDICCINFNQLIDEDAAVPVSGNGGPVKVPTCHLPPPCPPPVPQAPAVDGVPLKVQPLAQDDKFIRRLQLRRGTLTNTWY